MGQGWPVEERVKAYRIRAKDDEDCLLEHCGFGKVRVCARSPEVLRIFGQRWRKLTQGVYRHSLS